MNKNLYDKLITHDPELKEVCNRYVSNLKEISRLSANRQVALDTADDTRSYDVNIEIFKERADDQAERLNWVCRELGLGLPFPYYSREEK